MQHVKVVLLALAVFFAHASFAKGHGHGGHHSSHSHHSSHHSNSRSHSSSHHSNSHGHTASHATRHHSSHASSRTRHSGSSRSSARAARHAGRNRSISSRSTPASTGLRRGTRPSPFRTTRVISRPGTFSGRGVAVGHEHSWGFYHPWIMYNLYPGFGYPYYNMASWFINLGFSPTYDYPYRGRPYRSHPRDPDANGAVVNETLSGYVVYGADTLDGILRFEKKTVLLATTDSGQNESHKFKLKKKELIYISATNEDKKQLTLVRLKDEPKKLHRLIHEGRLSIYDTRRDFLYKPDDVDIESLTVVYDGHTEKLKGSPGQVMNQLTSLVNSLYGIKLDPSKFTWNELLIYVDKLD